MTEEVMHPTCKRCGKYIFAVDGCKGHKNKKEAPLPAKGDWDYGYTVD